MNLVKTRGCAVQVVIVCLSLLCSLPRGNPNASTRLRSFFLVVCKRNQVTRSLQKSDGTSGNNQESAEAGGGGAAGAAGDNSRRLRDGNDGSGRGASREDGAVVRHPGGGVARAGSVANGGGD